MSEPTSSSIWRRSSDPTPHRFAVLHNNGGLGDHIATIPAIRTILRENPHISLNVYCRDYFAPLLKALLRENTDRWSVKSFDKAAKQNKELDSVLMLTDRPQNSMRTDLVEFTFQSYMNRTPRSPQEAVYPTFPVEEIPLDRFDLPKDYVVLTPGFTSEVRAWLPHHINGVAEWLRAEGLTPVLMGSEKVIPGISAKWMEGIELGGVIDLRNTTSIVQAGAILGGARAVCGVDNGLLHLAACTKTNVVAGFTTVRAETRMPIRETLTGGVERGWRMQTIEPEMSLICRGCQSDMYFIEHDFKKCFYEDKECLDHMTAERFISKLRQVL